MASDRTPTRYSFLPKWLAWLDFLGIFEKDPFGNSLFIKRLMISLIGWVTYWRFTVVNKTKIEGIEHLENLPEHDVLFCPTTKRILPMLFRFTISFRA
jgi:hypothetical protein